MGKYDIYNLRFEHSQCSSSNPKLTSPPSRNPFSTQYRLVVKTALKLLLVFVEYSDTNAKYLIEAVTLVDSERGA